MAVGDTHVFPGFLTQFFFPKPPPLHASAKVRGENTPEKKKKEKLTSSTSLLKTMW